MGPSQTTVLEEPSFPTIFPKLSRISLLASQLFFFSIMRPSIFSLLLLALACCTPVSDTSPKPPPRPATLPVRAEQFTGNNNPITPDGKLYNSTTRYALEFKTATVAGVTLSFVAFDSRDYTLEVLDQAGLGTQFQSAAQAAKASGALAAINGGFFTPEGQPLGLLYHRGKKTGSLNTASSLGSGILYLDKSAPQPVLARRETFQKWLNSATFSPLEVLQTGPFLVEKGNAVSGLSTKESRVRSILLWDGEHHFALAQCEPISLRNLAGALAQQPLKDFDIQSALNLDGGRSSDLFISAKVSGGPKTLRRWWNKPVRNYIVLKPQ